VVEHVGGSRGEGESKEVRGSRLFIGQLSRRALVGKRRGKGRGGWGELVEKTADVFRGTDCLSSASTSRGVVEGWLGGSVRVEVHHLSTPAYLGEEEKDRGCEGGEGREGLVDHLSGGTGDREGGRKGGEGG